MNLFRSEDHIKAWSKYNSNSEPSIMPVSNWAYVMASPVFSQRFADGYLDQTDSYWEDFITRQNELGAYWE